MRRTSSAVLFVLPFLLATPSVRADTPAESGSVLDRVVPQDTVVVSSSKLRFRLADLATSATLIPRRDIELATGRNLQTTLASVPGAHVIDLSGSESQGVVEARGFASQGTSSHLLVLVDEVPVNDPESDRVNWSLLSPHQVDRVEFLRGPASFLYGDASMSGVVNVVTRKAEDGPTYWLAGNGGSQGRAEAAGGAGWSGGGRSFSGSASHQRLDGFRDHSGAEATNGYAYFETPLSTAWTVRVHGLGQRSLRDVPGPLPAPAWKDDPKSTITPLDRRDDRTAEGAVEVRGSITRDLEATAIVSGDARRVDATETIIPVGTLDRTSRLRTGRAEVRVHCTPTGLLSHVLVGGEIVDGRLESRYYDVGSTSPPIGAGDVERLSGGTFALVQLHPAEPWTISGGVRMDWLRSTIDDPTDPAPKSDNDDLRAFSPTAGVNWALPRGNAFVSYAGSFKAPTLEQLYDQRPYFLDFDGPGPSPPFLLRLNNHALEPQRGDHVEAGVRTWASGLWADATVFYARSKDEIGFDLANFTYSNIDKSIHWGFEGQIATQPWRGITGRLSYAYTRATFDGGAHDGHQINTVPEQQAFARVTAEHPYGGSATAELEMVRDQWLDEDNHFEIEPYALVHLGLTQSAGPVELFGSVRNLLDERYAGLGFLTIDEFGNDLPLYFPGAGRSFQAGMRLRMK